MGPGGTWRRRAARVGMIAACAVAIAAWASAFPIVVSRGTEPARPSAAEQPRNTAGVIVVHLKSVEIPIRNESTRSKHASASQRSGVAAATTVKVAIGKSARIDLRSQATHKTKKPVTPASTPTDPVQQPQENPSLPVTTSPATVEPIPVGLVGQPVQDPLYTPPVVTVPTGSDPGSNTGERDRTKSLESTQGVRKEPDQRPGKSSRPSGDNRSGGRR